MEKSYAKIASTNSVQKAKVIELYEEKVARDRNLIIHGIKPTTSDEELKTEVKAIVDACAGGMSENVISVKRIGKSKEGGNKNGAEQEGEKKKPIRVTLRDRRQRDEIVIAARSLKDTKHRGIYVNPDRTLEERKKIAGLREEAEKRNNEGNDLAEGQTWRVVGKLTPRLMKMTDSPQPKED